MGGFKIPKLDLNPFNDDNDGPDKDSVQGQARHLREEGRKWDGKGAPPSRDSAIGYLINHGVRGEAARSIVGERGTLTEVGNRVRGAASEREAQHQTWLEKWRADHPESEGPSSAENVIAAAEDGDVTEDELAALGLGGGPGDAASDARGAPLWRYEGDPETLAGIEVENKSWQDKLVQRAKHGFAAGKQERTGARYFQQDTIGPLRWSPEQRADLQRVLHGIGLYGDSKVKLGAWTAKDQAVYAELLASSNEEGLTWSEMLAEWKRHPPEDLLEQLKDSGAISKRPPIQVTNPMDIMQTAREVSRSLTGAVDRGFVEGTVKPYQGAETASQNAAYDLGEGDGGGTYAAPPSVGAFADDQLRRSHPIEVDGYQFVNQFQSLMSMLGVQ